jgi:hypothetical protein
MTIKIPWRGKYLIIFHSRRTIGGRIWVFFGKKYYQKYRRN